MGTWEVDGAYIWDWLKRQDKKTRTSVYDVIDLLRDRGPALGRPFADRARRSKYQNMKEPCPASSGDSEVRILFMFDPQRQAVLLLAGDKAHGKNNLLEWNRWYRRAIPEAEDRYEEHLARLERMGNADA